MAALGKFLRRRAVTISAFFTALGVALLAWAILAFENVEPFVVGEYEWFILIVGIVIVFISAGYVIDYFVKLRKFNQLIDVGKKSEFVKKHAELKKLADELGERQKEVLQKREAHFHLR